MKQWLIGMGLAISISASAAAETIKLSYNSDWPPYSFGEQENVKGVLPDLLEEIIGNRMGITTEHFGFPWKRAQENIRSARLDAMVTFPSEQRLEYALSSKNIVFSLQQRPVVQKGSTAESLLMKSPTIETLRGLDPCMMIGDGWSQTFYKDNNITPSTAPDTQSCLRLVASGRKDVFLHMEAAVNDNLRKADIPREEIDHLPVVFGQMNFTLLLSKDSPLAQGDFLKHFDETIQKMRADGSYDALVQRLNAKVYD